MDAAKSRPPAVPSSSSAVCRTRRVNASRAAVSLASAKRSASAASTASARHANASRSASVDLLRTRRVRATRVDATRASASRASAKSSASVATTASVRHASVSSNASVRRATAKCQDIVLYKHVGLASVKLINKSVFNLLYGVERCLEFVDSRAQRPCVSSFTLVYVRCSHLPQITPLYNAVVPAHAATISSRDRTTDGATL